MDLNRGAKAVENLEENASKLSKLIPELENVKDAIEALKTAEKSSQKQLQAYDKKLSKLEEQLTESLQLKLAEGLAEVSSRTRDLYDLGLKESEKSKAKITELKKEITSQAASISELGNELERVNKRISEIDTAGKKILTSVTKVEKSINQLSLGILVTAILAIILIFVL
jgi:chromosome segregation ATPase